MELLTHGGEHHEIGDGGLVDDDDGDESPSSEPRTDSRSALPREIRARRWLHLIKLTEIFFGICMLFGKKNPREMVPEVATRQGARLLPWAHP